MKSISLPTLLKGVLIGGIILLIAYISKSLFTALASEQPKTFWKYQCIDTMKLSRDRARSWNTPDHQKDIRNTMNAIKNLGANCVAIGTPYDQEFIPYLTEWVNAARKDNLHIWFRGNWSSWEGWFDYPKGMTTSQNLTKTHNFILENKDLIQDGDIFTSAPEAENGWKNEQYVPQNEYGEYRKFLIAENSMEEDTFKQIGKNVQTNWLSMSGGLAQDMYDQATLNTIGNVATIDHYVKSPSEMQDAIQYFHTQFNAKTVIGEFGAPIPDINGDMTEQQQKQFIQNLLEVMATNKQNVYAINYWVIQDGSTALLKEDSTTKPAAEAVKSYFEPALITGKIQNTIGLGIQNVRVATANGDYSTNTDSSGRYSLLIPSNQTVDIKITQNQYKSITRTITTQYGQTYTLNMDLTPLNPSSWYKFIEGMKRFYINIVRKI